MNTLNTWVLCSSQYVLLPRILQMQWLRLWRRLGWWRYRHRHRHGAAHRTNLLPCHHIRVHHHEKECDAMCWCSCGAHASHVNPDMPWFSCKRNTTPNRQTRSLGVCVCVGNVWRDVKLLPVWLLPFLASYLSMILWVPSIAFMLLLMVSFYGAEIWVFSEFRQKKQGVSFYGAETWVVSEFRPKKQGDTTYHWDCVQRSYQWYGILDLIHPAYLPAFLK